MASKGGSIIRLIDIVLNLLFGFLVISEIERKSPVKLPQSDVPIKREVDIEELMIVGVTRDKTTQQIQFLIEGQGEEQYVSYQALLNLILVRKEAVQRINQDKKMRVRIRSDWNLPIKYTMNITDFCRKNDILVGMDVQSVRKK